MMKQNHNFNEVNLVSVGNLLRTARKSKGLTLQELSNETGYNLNSISKYERAGTEGGIYPPLDKLAKLCSFLGVDPRDILAEAANDDTDTSGFYQHDSNENSLSQVGNLLGEAVAVMRRHGIAFDPLVDKIVDIDSFDNSDEEKLLGEPELYAIKFTMAKKGIRSRALPRLVNECLSLLQGMDYDDLYALAQTNSDQLWNELIEVNEFETEIPKKQDIICEQLAYDLIVEALYYSYFKRLTPKGMGQLAEDVSDALDDNAMRHFEGDAVDGRGFFESEEDFISRLRKQLPEALVKATIKSQPLDLFSNLKYERELDENEDVFISDDDQNENIDNNSENIEKNEN